MSDSVSPAAPVDLRAAVLSAFERIVESGSIEKAIESTITKTIESVIADQLRHYSDFGKQIEAAIKKSLALHGDIDLPSYNDAILTVLRRQVATYTNAAIERQVLHQIEELMTPAPESITLEKLVEEYIEYVKDRHSGGCVCYGEESITLHVEECSTVDGYFDIALDDEADQPSGKCDIQLSVNRSGEIFLLRFGNQTVKDELFTGPFYGFEKRLFQMKAAKTKLIVDRANIDCIDTSYAVGHE